MLNKMIKIEFKISLGWITEIKEVLTTKEKN